MYLPVEPQQSCALTWLHAVKAVNACPGHEYFNVVLDVADPLSDTKVDEAIISRVDTFLRKHESWPVQSVANTIFPEATYARHGSPEFYDVYLEKVYPRIKRKHGDWGRYFERMISYPLERKGKSINPLRELVTKMTEQASGERCFQNVYELSVYDPIRDAGPVMNRQCLSFLSFKIANETPKRLQLTAVYRNHYYIARLLGNLIGLGRLMSFVGDETGLSVGSLTVISTHAEIDPLGGRGAVQALLNECLALADS